MTSPARQQLIALLERTGTDPQVRRVVKALRRPSLPTQLAELEELIEELGGPDIAARVVAEVYRGGLSG
jgi:hypothetical protein